MSGIQLFDPRGRRISVGHCQPLARQGRGQLCRLLRELAETALHGHLPEHEAQPSDPGGGASPQPLRAR